MPRLAGIPKVIRLLPAPRRTPQGVRQSPDWRPWRPGKPAPVSSSPVTRQPLAHRLIGDKR